MKAESYQVDTTDKHTNACLLKRKVKLKNPMVKGFHTTAPTCHHDSWALKSCLKACTHHSILYTISMLWAEMILISSVYYPAKNTVLQV